MLAAALTSGILIGSRYRLERLLGEGGMGTVWAAEDVVSTQRVALKFVTDTASDPDARRRFVREGRAASAVRHPNVVSILEVLELDDGSPVIVMELLQGESLRDKVARERRMALGELAELLVPVISAVGTAHALGVVHRDVKPENIFLSRGAGGERIVKVLDFGIAKLTAVDSEAAQSTGITTAAVLGTPEYMAPEQVFGEKDVDHRADIWALGLILYQCLSGVLPTRGENIGQVFKNVLARPFERLDKLVPGIPQELSNLVARMLARERKDRPADLREVLEILEKFSATPGARFDPPAERSTGTDARGRDSADRVGFLTTIPHNLGFLTTAPHDAMSRRRSARVRAMLGGAAAVMLLGAGIALWWRSIDRGPEPIATGGIARWLSPLAEPSSVIACPILRASGVDEPAGWLGAAAAATACQRARVILGGRPERTLIPAELLGLPLPPVDSFQADPFGQPGAQERSLKEAKARAAAYLDGEVIRNSPDFVVSLALRRADETELGRGQGKGRALYEAVRAAMDPLNGWRMIPKAIALDPHIASWSRTRDIDAALGLLDLTFALTQNAGGLSDECARFEKVSSRLGELGPAGRWLCAYAFGLPTPTVDLDASDPSPEAVATRIRINHFIHHADKSEDADLLHQLFERDENPWGKSLLAATESCLRQSSDPERAFQLAISAVRNAPENPDGEQCYPWGQLLTMVRSTKGGDTAARAMQAWSPWDSYGWLDPGLGVTDPHVLMPLRRAHVLTPLDVQVADTLAGNLVAAGQREAARKIALDVREGK